VDVVPSRTETGLVILTRGWYSLSCCASLCSSKKPSQDLSFDLPPLTFGTNADNRKSSVSAPKNKKNAPAAKLGNKRRKRREEKLIRLDDLIPKQDVTGGHQLLFGVTRTTQPNKKGK